MIFENRFDPIIFHLKIGWFDLAPRWYGLAYVIGFVLGYMALKRAVKAGRVPGLEEKHLEPLLTWLIVGVVIGGRIGFVLQNLATWAKDPMFPLKIYEGGMAFFGGLAGVVLAVLWFCHRNKIKFGHLADVITVPAALGLGIGRIANFINGELWGVPTNSNWGVIYPKSGTIQPRHPSELYEMATHFLLAGILVLAGKSRLGAKRGALSAIFVLVYGLLRIVTEKFRTADTYIGPLTSGQVASIVIAVVGVVALWLVSKRNDVDAAPVEPTETTPAEEVSAPQQP